MLGCQQPIPDASGSCLARYGTALRTATRQEDERRLADVAVRFINLRDDESVRATAIIALPWNETPAVCTTVPRARQGRAPRL